MTRLSTLKLDHISHGQLSPLTSLQSLRHLSVIGFQPVGLEHVLSSVPLNTLDLDILDSHFPKLPPGERLASNTLVTLCINGNLYHRSDWLSMLDFPCLKFLHFKREISLWVHDPLENEDVLERAARVAGWLGKQGLTWTGKVDGFSLRCYHASQPFKSASFCTALFKRLFVMAHQLGSICKLSLGAIKLSHASLRDMATLFPHVSHLTLSHLGLCSPLALPDFLAYLPLLTSVEVYGVMYTDMGEVGVHVVMSEDLHALLCAARDGRRELSLHTWDYVIGSELEATWGAEASKQPLHAPVRLFRY
ncbi:hypothetical protein DUNSADRAFT_8841 [Dunaliella salina]|uniref:Encoded protein n=1 Tax=Dunaliella salina TaxID=3046 RepID=A0ABQ7H5M1_DUNSA|nr:hypothetical protein DUNSADRAFT_8841 [Dunaliella salina]|eukprot:KAF5842154.1 hypothetical protein DUNSADRAFT_8841 [Dunaliella salina]